MQEAPAAQMITGTCNRCGACCYVGEFRCANLVDAPDGRASCAIHANRVPGMVVIMTRPNGDWIEGICNHTLPIEDRLLTPLIEQGVCSMEIKDNG